MKYLEIKKPNRYVKGVVGQDIRLSLLQRIKLLFCKGISVALLGSDVCGMDQFNEADVPRNVKESWNHRAPLIDEAKLLEEIARRMFRAECYNKDLDGVQIDNLLCFGDVAEIIDDFFELPEADNDTW